MPERIGSGATSPARRYGDTVPTRSGIPRRAPYGASWKKLDVSGDDSDGIVFQLSAAGD